MYPRVYPRVVLVQHHHAKAPEHVWKSKRDTYSYAENDRPRSLSNRLRRTVKGLKLLLGGDQQARTGSQTTVCQYPPLSVERRVIDASLDAATEQLAFVHFLQLPQEVRQEIYAVILKGKTLDCCLGSTGLHGLQLSDFKPAAPVAAALLFTCRQVYHEMRDFTATMISHTVINPGRGILGRRSFGSDYLNMVRKLSFHSHDLLMSHQDLAAALDVLPALRVISSRSDMQHHDRWSELKDSWALCLGSISSHELARQVVDGSVNGGTRVLLEEFYQREIAELGDITKKRPDLILEFELVLFRFTYHPCVFDFKDIELPLWAFKHWRFEEAVILLSGSAITPCRDNSRLTPNFSSVLNDPPPLHVYCRCEKFCNSEFVHDRNPGKHAQEVLPIDPAKLVEVQRTMKEREEYAMYGCRMS